MTSMQASTVPLQSVTAPAQLLLFQSGDLLLHEHGLFWPVHITERLEKCPELAVAVDLTGSIPCYAVTIEDSEGLTVLGAERRSPRQLLQCVCDADFALVGKALQLLHWVASHRYCGHCGAVMQPYQGERALQCVRCEARVYPRISPCVIVLVTRGDEMLLARHSGRSSQFFSCLAGYMEVGETPEETIHREVLEETSIRVSNIRYARSQSWPFPSQLMLGFIADYAGGEIKVDGSEIVEAAWFRAEALPQIPSAGFSVAGQLIELFLKSRRT